MKIINNFTESVFIKNVLEENNGLLYKNVWRSNLGWQNEIISPSGAVLVRSLTDEQKNQLRKSLISNDIIRKNDVIELDVQAYVWHRLSYIPWHSDKDDSDNVRYAATLYLNEEWNEDWGGLFLYKFNNEIRAEAPLFNKLVFNDQNFPHATTILGVDAPFRHTIQLFWKIIK